MFTGLVEEQGTLAARHGERLRFHAITVLDGAAPGDSISVSGSCLTVVAHGDGWWEAEITPETAKRTTLGALPVGAAVNFERPVRLSDRLGGHVVLGHVDAVGTVVAPPPDLRVRIPAELIRYCVEKGSIAVDGVSLTIFDVDQDSFAAAIIPHTAATTSLGRAAAGTPVNVEVDVSAKHVEKLVAAYLARPG